MRRSCQAVGTALDAHEREAGRCRGPRWLLRTRAALDASLDGVRSGIVEAVKTSSVSITSLARVDRSVSSSIRGWQSAFFIRRSTGAWRSVEIEALPRRTDEEFGSLCEWSDGRVHDDRAPLILCGDDAAAVMRAEKLTGWLAFEPVEILPAPPPPLERQPDRAPARLRTDKKSASQGTDRRRHPHR
jgi:hypothetical protein